MTLQAAVAAVRDESLERGTAELMTRRRVLASIERSPSRRVHAIVAAIIASMFGASAFAWYARTPEHVAPPSITAEAAPASAEPIARPDRVTSHVEVVPAEPTVEPAPEPEPAPAPEPVSVMQVAPHERSPDAARAPQPDPELALYATAHHLHFQEHDLAAALVAWDRYLAAAPAGKLAPEARFNRLVALVKLGRWDDAARAVDTIDDTVRAADVAKLRRLISSRRPR